VATAAWPMVPLAPARLSTTMGWPRLALILSVNGARNDVCGAASGEGYDHADGLARVAGLGADGQGQQGGGAAQRGQGEAKGPVHECLL